MKHMKIDVLGTEYDVAICAQAEDARLYDCDGFCDETIRQCVVTSYEDKKGNLDCKKRLSCQLKMNIRHDLIHAFLFESGLAENSPWAQEEEMVDWFAKQFPKLMKAFKDAGAL